MPQTASCAAVGAAVALPILRRPRRCKPWSVLQPTAERRCLAHSGAYRLPSHYQGTWMTTLRSASRALARLASVMALILIIAAAAGIGYEQFSRVSAASSVAPPVGEIVCRGSGSPVVLMFSTGYLPASVPWPTVQP